MVFFARRSVKPSFPQLGVNGKADVVIRSFQSRDSQAVRDLFAVSMGEMRGPLVRDVMCRVGLYGSCLFVPCCAGTLVLSCWLFALFLVVSSAVVVALFAGIHIGFSIYIQDCLNTDLHNIESTYMCRKGSHFWVAEHNERIIGMVGLDSGDRHEGAPREDFGRLRRMAVLPEFRRLGVAQKLVNVLLKHAKQIGFRRIDLLTTSAQQAAIRFYRNNGFRLVSKRLANRALRGFYHYIYTYDLDHVS